MPRSLLSCYCRFAAQPAKSGNAKLAKRNVGQKSEVRSQKSEPPTSFRFCRYNIIFTIYALLTWPPIYYGVRSMVHNLLLAKKKRQADEQGMCDPMAKTRVHFPL